MTIAHLVRLVERHQPGDLEACCGIHTALGQFSCVMKETPENANLTVTLAVRALHPLHRLSHLAPLTNDLEAASGQSHVPPYPNDLLPLVIASACIFTPFL